MNTQRAAAPHRTFRARTVPFVGLIAAGAAALAAAPTATAGAGPLTGFEQRSGGWTSLEQEADFVDRLDDSARVRVDEVGRTTRSNRPLRLITVGRPSADATLLVVCGQHGDEPAGREACLQSARNLAFSTDEATTAMLGRTSIAFLATANPEGTAAGTRANGSGTDINRDHASLNSAEARAIARVMTDRRPDIVLDLHECEPSCPTPAVRYRRTLNTDVSPDVAALSLQLGRDYVKQSLSWSHFDTALWNGDTSELFLRNQAGLRGSVPLLVETPRSQLDSRDRVRAHKAAVSGAVRMLNERTEDLAAATRER